MGSSQPANFCPNCGSAVALDDAFCSNCGSHVHQAGATESGVGGTGIGGPATDSRSLRRRIEDLTIEGWEVEHDYGDRVVLVDRGFGSWAIHAILAVFTGGLGNVAYAWYNYSPNADRLELRSDGTERYLSGSSPNAAPSNRRSSDAKSVAVSVILGVVGIAILEGVSSFAVAFLGIAFVLAALFTFPPTRRRLRDRTSVTTFGRAQSTDETAVTETDEPCTACSRPVETGVKRTYRERTYVAGIPITTNEKGENVYCRTCASGDPFSVTGDAGTETEAEKEETEFEF